MYGNKYRLLSETYSLNNSSEKLYIGDINNLYNKVLSVESV